MTADAPTSTPDGADGPCVGCDTVDRCVDCDTVLNVYEVGDRRSRCEQWEEHNSNLI